MLSNTPSCPRLHRVKGPKPLIMFSASYSLSLLDLLQWICGTVFHLKLESGPTLYQLLPTSHQFKNIFFAFLFYPKLCLIYPVPALWNRLGSDVSTGKLPFLSADWPGSFCPFLPGSLPSAFSPLGLRDLGFPALSVRPGLP